MEELDMKISDNGKNAVVPALYLCATPIGNMEDMTLRVIKTLGAVDAIYAEDTRNTLKLLNRFGIKKPLVSCHEHNEAMRAAEIVERIRTGEAVAFVSDAGMPGISDPGGRLISACTESGTPFFVLPGASAALLAHVMANLSTEYRFVGFLPREKGECKKKLLSLSDCDCPMVFYESPLRVAKTVALMLESFGERNAVLVRELTKLYESMTRGTLSSLVERYSDTPPKGECVLVVDGRRKAEQTNIDPETVLTELLGSGKSAKDSAKELAARGIMPKNEAYALALRIAERL
ncbi:MAG: 16S rRNA (cytidine(1402)-2'-O)-methyltransferase [Eubacteriales bacterium]|nr:16S rRNA (cytidine(1402)-2'-O)-methyltransferase [Eubacteriales bacterium]MCI7571295.1 16S rRNA (cytidine(1402)-2'-O)-methyltransferase [Clostridiales bacterium]MDD7550904.1 16S rRNA (cytidine(1402)-2'-O)-methyltransferase [Clostridia bacterium]MDY5753911.1 16S rRNA (cytidine(1402)-2'-O)-methyltransferase [Eubacteriales bacterium]